MTPGPTRAHRVDLGQIHLLGDLKSAGASGVGFVRQLVCRASGEGTRRARLDFGRIVVLSCHAGDSRAGAKEV